MLQQDFDLTSQYRLRVPFRFHTNSDRVIDLATEIGRSEGLESDWVPDSLARALFEILLFPESADTSDIEVRPACEVDRGDRFVVTIKLHIEPHLTHEDLASRAGRTTQTSLDDILIQGCSSEASPADLGFEILDVVAPVSAHEKLEEIRRFRAAILPRTDPQSRKDTAMTKFIFDARVNTTISTSAATRKEAEAEAQKILERLVLVDPATETEYDVDTEDGLDLLDEEDGDAAGDA